MNVQILSARRQKRLILGEKLGRMINDVGDYEEGDEIRIQIMNYERERTRFHFLVSDWLDFQISGEELLMIPFPRDPWMGIKLKRLLILISLSSNPFLFL